MKLNIITVGYVGLCAAALYFVILAITPKRPSITDSVYISDGLKTNASVTFGSIDSLKPNSGDKLKTLVDTYFETGFKIGYSCGARGGSLGDAEFLLLAYRNGDTNALIKWMDTHP